MKIREQIKNAAASLASTFVLEPPALAAAQERVVDLLVDGKMEFMGQIVEIGRKSIDWSAGHVDHHCWRSRPCRFAWLPPLAAAYAETDDERYAEAAADY